MLPVKLRFTTSETYRVPKPQTLNCQQYSLSHQNLNNKYYYDLIAIFYTPKETKLPTVSTAGLF